MVGGLVIEIAEVMWDGGRRVYLNCREQVWSSKERRKVPTKNTCAIFVEMDERAPYVELGDMVWWQGGIAFWTPRDRSDESLAALTLALGITNPVEVELRRVGASGVDLDFVVREGGRVLSSRKENPAGDLTRKR